MARGFCYWLRRSPSWLTLLFPHSTVGRRYFLAAIGCTLEWERKMRDGRWDWKRVTLKIERTIRLTKTVIRILLLLSISYSYLEMSKSRGVLNQTANYAQYSPIRYEQRGDRCLSFVVGAMESLQGIRSICDTEKMLVEDWRRVTKHFERWSLCTCQV